MSDDDAVRSVVREWVEKADNDLRNAAHTLKIKRNCPTDTVCFHAQQCVEKYVKAFLTFSGIDFPRTHAIERLVALIPSDARPSLTDDEQDQLTEYATVTRYPGGYEPIPVGEARQAVRIARRVRRDVRALLPPSTHR